MLQTADPCSEGPDKLNGLDNAHVGEVEVEEPYQGRDGEGVHGSHGHLGDHGSKDGWPHVVHHYRLDSPEKRTTQLDKRLSKQDTANFVHGICCAGTANAVPAQPPLPYQQCPNFWYSKCYARHLLRQKWRFFSGSGLLWDVWFAGGKATIHFRPWTVGPENHSHAQDLRHCCQLSIS
ncbi:unnamed protein product [Ixodes pacificus]